MSAALARSASEEAWRLAKLFDHRDGRRLWIARQLLDTIGARRRRFVPRRYRRHDADVLGHPHRPRHHRHRTRLADHSDRRFVGHVRHRCLDKGQPPPSGYHVPASGRTITGIAGSPQRSTAACGKLWISQDGLWITTGMQESDGGEVPLPRRSCRLLPAPERVVAGAMLIAPARSTPPRCTWRKAP